MHESKEKIISKEGLKSAVLMLKAMGLVNIELCD